MPMNFTPKGDQPAGGAAPAKFAPTRSSPSMAGNTAPIPGEEQQQRPAARPPPAAGGAGAEEQESQGGEQEGGEGQPNADISWRLGLVSKQSARARQLMTEAKAAAAAAEARVKELDKRQQAIEAEEARRVEWRRNPKRLLEDHGFVPEAAVQYMLNGEKLTPEQALAASVDERLAEERQATETELKRIRDEQAEALRKQQEDQEKRDQEELSLAEQTAVEELQADISDIIAGDAKAFPLILQAEKKRPGGGIAAIYDRINAISDEQYQKTGRRPPVTTKMLERAASEVEKAAQDELREALGDQDIAAALGVGGVRPRVPQTLTNRLAPAQSGRTNAEREETAEEKKERVKAMIQPLLRGGRAR